MTERAGRPDRRIARPFRGLIHRRGAVSGKFLKLFRGQQNRNLASSTFGCQIRLHLQQTLIRSGKVGAEFVALNPSTCKFQNDLRPVSGFGDFRLGSFRFFDAGWPPHREKARRQQDLLVTEIQSGKLIFEIA